MLQDKLTQKQRIRFESFIMAMNMGNNNTMLDIFNRADSISAYIEKGEKPSESGA